MNDTPAMPMAGDRLAKVMARSGLCSRRDAEEWIRAGRVTVNGKKILTPAFNVATNDEVVVDGAPLADRQGTRVWLYHKPRGLVVTEKDPEGRATIFEALAESGLPRVVSVGRLDINTEGLLLLTNDGGLKRVLELPATGWLRKYRVRAHGTVTQAQLDALKQGTEIDGVKYGPIEATLERDQGANVWLEVALREGKNREVKNVLMGLGLEVNRLIRISFGPFQLGDLPIGGIEAVKARVLKDQLGKRLAAEADVDFDAEQPAAIQPAARARRAAAPAVVEERQFGRGTHTVAVGQQRFRFTDRAEKTPAEMEELRRQRPRQDRPGRGSGDRGGRPAPTRDAPEETRQIHFDDGREPAVFEEKLYGKKPERGAKGPGAKAGPRKSGDRPDRGPPSRDFAAKPRTARTFGDKARPADGAGERPRSAAGFRGKPRTGDAPTRPRAPRAAEGDVRPARTGFAKPRAPRADGDKPARSFGDKPARSFGAKPAGSFAGKPRAPRAADAGKPRAPRTGDAGKPRTPRTADAGKPARAFEGKPRSARPAGAKPGAPRSTGVRPRPAADKPRGPRKDGPPRPPRKPRGA